MDDDGDDNRYNKAGVEILRFQDRIMNETVFSIF